jgi:hemerythrin-like domain-containing protein
MEIVLNESIFELVESDHDRLRELVSLIEENEGMEERRTALRDLYHLLELNLGAEEEAIYSQQAGRSDSEAQGLIPELLNEHAELRAKMEALLGSDPAREGWVAQLEDALSLLELHIDHEESELFDWMQRIYPTDRLWRFAEAYQKTKQRLMARLTAA